MLRKCKTLSRQLGRSSSYSSLRSKSTRDELWGTDQYHGVVADHDTEHRETIIVGSSRRRYAVKSEFLSHPLLSALIEKSKKQSSGSGNDIIIAVKCEVVLFDHLLWMLENADPTNLNSDSFEELADLYVV